MFMQHLLMSIFFQCHWLDPFVWFSFHQLIWFHNQYRNVNTPFLVQFNSHLLNIAHTIQSARTWSIRSHHYMYPGSLFFWAATQLTLFLVNTANCKASRDRPVVLISSEQWCSEGPARHMDAAPETSSLTVSTRPRHEARQWSPTAGIVGYSRGWWLSAPLPRVTCFLKLCGTEN